MTIELRLATDAETRIVKNLWPLYQHDVSALAGLQPNAAGIFSDDDRWTTLTEFGETLTPWWNEPGVLFPYLIWRADRPIPNRAQPVPVYAPGHSNPRIRRLRQYRRLRRIRCGLRFQHGRITYHRGCCPA